MPRFVTPEHRSTGVSKMNEYVDAMDLIDDHGLCVCSSFILEVAAYQNPDVLNADFTSTLTYWPEATFPN